MTAPAIEIRLHGERLWIRQDYLDQKEGPLMPTPTADKDWVYSFAYLYADGMIRRFGIVIGTFEDIVVVKEEGP